MGFGKAIRSTVCRPPGGGETASTRRGAPLTKTGEDRKNVIDPRRARSHVRRTRARFDRTDGPFPAEDLWDFYHLLCGVRSILRPSHPLPPHPRFNHPSSRLLAFLYGPRRRVQDLRSVVVALHPPGGGRSCPFRPFSGLQCPPFVPLEHHERHSSPSCKTSWRNETRTCFARTVPMERRNTACRPPRAFEVRWKADIRTPCDGGNKPKPGEPNTRRT